MLEHRHTTPVKPERVLLLGAGGFLAPQLLGVLAVQDIPARAIGSAGIDLTAPGAADRLAAEILSGDAVVMAAALTPDRGRDIATLMRNFRMGEHVCAAIAQRKPAHFVYVSSDGIYDGRSSLVNEDTPCETGDLYALAHVVREKMLLATCQKAGVPLAIVRPCAIYGPRDTHNSYGPNRFIRTALKDGTISLFGGGEEQRDHIHVRDVAGILHRILIHRSTGVLNAVTGKAWSFREVADRIAAIVGRQVRIVEQPRGGPVSHRHYDITALTRAFPNFTPIPFDEGLAETVKGMAAGAV
jgi:nucleoside-diphosphate-sugar epimerase